MSFTAPGSVILAGEYAMLYGKPALATAIGYYTTASTDEKPNDEKIQNIEEAVIALLKKRKLYNGKKIYVRCTSDIPYGQAFGKNDAQIVAIVALMLKMLSEKAHSIEEIPSIAYQIEKQFNDKELGINCAVSVFGGLVYYRKEFEFLKNISSLNMKIPKAIEKKLFVIDTGKQNKPSEELKYTKKTESIYNEMEKVTKRLVISIAKEDTDFFRESITRYEELLEDLGVVPQFIKRIIRNLEEFGGAKTIGDRYLLAYVEDEDKLKKLVEKYHVSYVKFHQSVKGLFYETI